MNKMAEVYEIGAPFKVYELPYGAYITNCKGKPLRVILSDGQEIDVSELDVVIHDSGIEFLIEGD